MATVDWTCENWIPKFDDLWMRKFTKKPVQVIYNPPYTIVIFNDKTKSVVKCHNEDFDSEKGFAMAIVKSMVGRIEFERMMEKGLKSLKNQQEKLKENK